VAATVDQATIGQNDSDSAATLDLTTTQPVAAGATILIWWSFEHSVAQTFTSVAGGGLTWDSHEISNSLIGNYVIGYSIARAPTGLAAGSTITITVSAAAPNLLLFGSSFNGVLSASPIDDDNHRENAAPAANAVWDCGALTTTQAGDVVAACCIEAQDAARSSVPLTDYFETHQFARGTDDTWTAVYRIVGAAGNYTPGGTWDNASDNGWGAIGVALKAAPEEEIPTTPGYWRLYGPAQLDAAAATLYTAAVRTRIRNIHAFNPSGGVVDVTLSIGTDAAATRIWDAQEVPAGDSYVERRRAAHTLEAGETIQGFASSAGTVVLVIDGYLDP